MGQVTPLTLPATKALRLIRAALADPRLTPAQRVVVAAVIGQADAATGRAWASYRQLRRDFGLSSDAVASTLRKGIPGAVGGIGAAIGRYLEVQAVGRAGAVCYQVLTHLLERSVQQSAEPTLPVMDSAPPSRAPGRNQQEERRSGQQSATDDSGELIRQEALRSGGPSALPGGAILNPSFLNNTPPTPPQAGECVRVSGLLDLLDPSTIPTLELEILIVQADKAYRTIHARGMPASWRRKIKREYRLGDRESLAEIDEKAIRGGIKLANKKERTFGFGWVLRYLSDQAAARIARAEANRNRQTSQTTQEESDTQAEAEKAAQAAQADQRRAYFDGLPDELQKTYMEKAMAGPFMPRRLDVIRYVAAQMAWQDREGSGIAIQHG